MTDLQIFKNAPPDASAEELKLYLDGACGGDATLRLRVEALFQAEAKAGGFMKHPAMDGQPTVLASSPVQEGPGTQIGRYKLLQEIGAGGFGVVYMADQKEPVKRRIALKIIKVGMDTEQVVARFEAERQALAVMDHPNIAKVLDAGATDTGRPYFVMELVKGVRITEYCDDSQLTTKERLELFIPVCQAIQHAHQKGIIHRDIKPSNVMVTLHDGVPVPKVIDFGIAKATQAELTEKTIFTQYGQFIGTPAYMSPEQAEMSGLDIDTRSDIYSLGVLLYELLVGRPPLDTKELMSGGFDEMRRRIKEEQPAKPSTRLRTLEGAEKTSAARHRKVRPEQLSSELRGDLDWIVLKTLEKDRTRRYETANGLAADLKRHLNNEPVVARPPSTAYRMKKFVRRNRLAVAAGGAVVVTLIVGVVLSSIGFVQARLQRDRAVHSGGEAKASAAEAELQRKLAETRADELRRNLYVSNIARAATGFEAGNMAAMRTLLDACPEDLRHWEWGRLDWLAPSATELLLPGWELPLFTPDGRQIIALGDLSLPGAIKVWDAVTGELIRTFGQQKEIKLRSDALSPDGQWLAVGDFTGGLRLWEVASGEMRWMVPPPNAHQGRIDGLAFSPDGASVASVSWSGDLAVRKAANGHVQMAKSLGHNSRGVAFSPKGDRLVTGLNLDGPPDVARVWDAATGEEVLALRGGGKRSTAITFSPDGRWIVGGGDDGSVTVWNATTGELEWSRPGHSGRVYSMAFSPDSQLLASGSEDSIVRLWDAATGSDRGKFREHKSHHVWWLSFSPDGQRIASVAGVGGADQVADDGMRVWKVARVQPDVLTLRGKSGVQFSALAFSPDSGQLAAVGSDGTFKRWDARSGLESDGPHNAAEPIACVAYDAIGKLLATGGADGMVRFYNLDTGQPVRTLRDPQGGIAELAFSPDGSNLASSGSRAVRIWELSKGQLRLTLEGSDGFEGGIAWYPDGKRVVTSSHDQSLKLWDAVTGRLLHTLRGEQGIVHGLTVSPDGQLIASGGRVETIKIWNANTGKEIRSLAGHSAAVNSVVFSSDGQRLFSASNDRTVKVWNTATWEEMLTLRGHEKAVTSMVASPDGRMIASASSDGTVKIWKSNHRSPTRQSWRSVQEKQPAPR